MTIGEKFKYFINSKFGSIKNGAKAFEVPPSTFYDYFNNKTTPGGNMIKKCYKYGMNLNWLFGQNEYKMMRTLAKNNYTGFADLFGDLRSELEVILNFATLENNEIHKISTFEFFKSNDRFRTNFEKIVDSIENWPHFDSIKKLELSKELYALIELNPFLYRKGVFNIIDNIRKNIIKTGE